MKPYYSDPFVTLYHGDCLELADLWTCADVLVTDPPYGVAYADKTGRTVAGDHDFTAASLAVLAAGQMPMAVFACHASLARTLAIVPHPRTRVMTWHKTNVNGAAGMGNPWMADVEFAVCGVPEWPRRAASGLVAAPRSTGNPDWQSRNWNAFLHPTQKPLAVMEAVLDAMPPGTVADPFAGSGSTLVAAKALGRRAIGVELEERYAEIAARRLSQDVLDFEERPDYSPTTTPPTCSAQTYASPTT